ncbi:MAG: chorismate synthase [Clostridia bacterium]
MDTWGRRLRLSISGGARGEYVGCTVEGLPAGMRIDFNAVRAELAIRAPRADGLSTPRREVDNFILSGGMTDGVTDGSPIICTMPNADAKADGRSKTIPRPSHADYAAYVKYGGASRDIFSGRMCAPIVFAGALARQLLSAHGVFVAAHIACIGSVNDAVVDPVAVDRASLRMDSMFPLLDISKKEPMLAELNKARTDGDSIGGAVECVALNLPVGLGEPFFDTLEGQIAQLLFSIPGVKGVEFGAGFSFAQMRGAEANDGFCFKNGLVRTITNNSGGINGGMANGMPLIVRTVLRPIPSIALAQKTVDLKTGEEIVCSFTGRNDVCILPRGTVVIEAAVCFALAELMLRDTQ